MRRLLSSLWGGFGTRRTTAVGPHPIATSIRPDPVLWLILCGGLLVTAIIVIEFIVDAKIGTAPPPQVTYVELYPSNRTDAEIVADQKKDQAAKEAAIKERQRQFQKLENQLGM